MATRNCPKLDARLLAAASLVTKGNRVADIGCDHGLLAIWLAKQGDYPAVIACDLRPKPLAVAQKNCKLFGCEGLVQCRLGNGLSPLQPNEVDSIVLAGVSAFTSIAVLSAQQWVFQKGVQLVLVPATKPERLRRWLWQSGFAIQQEKLAQVAGRWYTAIQAEYCATPVAPTEQQCILGKTQGQAGDFAYACQESVKLAKYRRSLPDSSPEAAQLDAFLQQIRRHNSWAAPNPFLP